MRKLPEFVIFIVGALLRLTMAAGWRYRAEWGYDAGAHWLYIQSIADGALPDPAVNHVAYHPPLYHAIAAALVKFGATWQGLIWLSAVCGVGRLGIIWAGLECCIPLRRARLAALALAAVLPSSIMIDGMTANESLNGLLCAAAMLLWLKGRSSIAVGMLSGLALLTKASAVAMLMAFGIRRRLMVLAVCLMVIPSLYWLRGHSPFATSYEIAPERMGHVEINIPYLSRRAIGFLGWDWGIYASPYYPTAIGRFAPVVLASTFVDYYNHSFAGNDGALTINGRPMAKSALWMGRLAMVGGTLIFIATLAAWVMSVRRVVIDRKWEWAALLVVPLLATLLAFAFAVKYPYDSHGVIKGAYIQFGALPLYAMFGLAVEWALADRRRWAAGMVLLLSLATVAIYSICCRTGLFI